MPDPAAPAPKQDTQGKLVLPEGEAAKEAAKEVIGEKLKEVEPKELIAQFLAMSRTSIGPDAETAKILAQIEMHAETSKLEAYSKHLETRDKQNQRDHEFRCTKLKHDNFNLKIILLAAVLGCIGGVALLLNGHPVVGSNVLIASALTVFNLIGGKSPFSSKE